MKTIEQPLGDELLIYDEDEHKAYALDADLTARWHRVKIDLQRRKILALAAAAGASLLAPTTAEAASCGANAVTVCQHGDNGRACQSPSGGCGRCLGSKCR